MKRNITEISKELYLSQPTVSYRLSKLQQELNSTLYEYDGKYHFTEEGTLFYQYCERILADLEDLQSRFSNQQVFRINLSAAANYLYLNKIYGCLSTLAVYPIIRSTNSDSAIVELMEGRSDIAIVGGIKLDLPSDIKKIKLKEEKIVFIYHENLPDDIQQIPIINDESGSGLHSLVTEFLEQYPQARITGEIGTYSDKLALVGMHPVGCFIPETYLDVSPNQNVHISSKYFFTRNIFLLFHKENETNKVVKNLIEKLNPSVRSIEN